MLRRLGRLISETLPLSRYLLAGLKYANGRNAAKHTLSRRIDEGARRLADRAALAILTTNLPCCRLNRFAAMGRVSDLAEGGVEGQVGVGDPRARSTHQLRIHCAIEALS